MSRLNKEKLCLIITGAICLFGCVFLSVYNVIEANYSSAEIIARREYNEGLALTDTTREPSAVSPAGTININTASAKELADFLPGIGEKKAERIVEYRRLAGEFVSVDELIKVDGIGEKTLENIRPYCRISDD